MNDKQIIVVERHLAPEQIQEVATLEAQDYLVGLRKKGGAKVWVKYAYGALLSVFSLKSDTDSKFEEIESKIVDDETLQDIVDIIVGSTNEPATATLVATTEDNQQHAFKLSIIDSWYGYGYGGGGGIIGKI